MNEDERFNKTLNGFGRPRHETQDHALCSPNAIAAIEVITHALPKVASPWP